MSLNSAAKRLGELDGGDGDSTTIIEVYYSHFDGHTVLPPEPGAEPISIIKLVRDGTEQIVQVIKGIDLDEAL